MTFVGWKIDPMIAFNFAKRFKYVFKHSARDTVEGILQTLSQAVRPIQDHAILYNCSVATKYYFYKEIMEPTKIIYWSPPTLPILLPTLTNSSGIIRSYGIRQLLRSPDTAQIFYLQQTLLTAEPLKPINQYSRFTFEEDACTYLVTASTQSQFLRNHIEWVANVYLRYQEENKPPEDRSNALMRTLLDTVMSELRKDAEKLREHDAEVNFFDGICSLSGSLKPKAPENVSKIKEGLIQLTGPAGTDIPAGIYLPTNPDAKVVGVNVNSGVTLQSAKRVPILIVFKTVTGGELQTTPCIFKVNDDVRNDQLSLQLIEFMRDIFHQHKLPLYLRPYKVISNMTTINSHDYLGGIIECIPSCKSRDEIGKEGSSSLYTYFIEKFGSEDTRSFQIARKNFIESLAAYSIASYILQIKDRHNGNILIDGEGHLLHIDFGFILSISPAGNMRFERPDFKMTTEMTELMGSETSEPFRYFQELVIKGFVLVREYAPELITMVDMMKSSGYTCFKPDTLSNLQSRFFIEKSLPKVANKMQSKIYWANNSIFTNWYDRIQLVQQKIEY